MRNEKPQNRAKEQSLCRFARLIKYSGKQTISQAQVRLFLLGGFFSAVFLAIAVKFAYLTLSGMGDSAEAVLAKYRAQKPHYERAEIIDRNGEILATTLETASLYAKPREISTPRASARALKRIFPDLDVKDLQEKLESGRSFIWIKRHITPRQQQLVNNLGEPGLDFEPEFKRIYPHANLFAHVLGFVNVDGKGMAGIERGHEEYLRNKNGGQEPLRLSVDLRIQAIVRQELHKAVEEFQAVGATGVVMDIYSGEVLALSNLPDFDPHNPGGAKAEARFNRATQGVYEMGSTFKTFTMAVALEEGVANMHSSYDATKPIRIARFSISDSHPENRWLSLPEVFAYSSNIGTAKIIMDVGAKRQREFLRHLGMEESLSLDIPETASPLLPAHWSDVYMMTISFGHGIAVTPMHLVRAIAALTGDGNIRPITFLKQEGNVSGERVLSEENVMNIRKLLRLVVQEGTASKADVAGYRVGGKTGTAEKTVAGGYNRTSNIASFVGVFPIDNPKYLVLVMVDEPKGNKSTYGFATGGWVAAPVAGKIVARMGPMLGIRPIFDGPVRRRSKDPRQWHYYDGGAVHAVTF